MTFGLKASLSSPLLSHRVRWVLAVTASLLAVSCGDSREQASPAGPVEWLASRAIPVASVDPDNRDFTDLDALRQVIGDSRVVLLGEQSHGDGTTFLAKSRLIEFLHQEMDFDVLAFESGLYNVRKAWQALLAGEEPRIAFDKGVYGIWTGSAQVQPLIEYVGAVAHTDRPLEIAGVDTQFGGSSNNDFIPDLEAFLRREGAPILADDRWPSVRAMLPGVLDRSGSREKPPEEAQAHFGQVMTEMRQWLGGDEAGEVGSERRFWSQLVKSLLVHAEGRWATDRNNFTLAMANYRDEQMADNLLWFVDDWYRGRKIIVWAATPHIFRNVRDIDSRLPDLDYADWMSMGHRVWEALGDDAYILGFTAYEGEAARWMFDDVIAVPVPTPGSLEDLMGRAGLQNAIVDFRSAGPALEWLAKPMIARPAGYNDMVADWTSALDGIFFTRVMTRSTPAKPLESR